MNDWAYRAIKNAFRIFLMERKDAKPKRIKGKVVERIKRKCLGPECNKTFTADGKFQRLCHDCRKLTQYRFI